MPVALVPSVSIKDRTVARPVAVEILQLATYSGKPDISAIPIRETTTAHWEWRDGESSVYPPSNGLDGGVLCSRVARTRSRFGGSE